MKKETRMRQDFPLIPVVGLFVLIACILVSVAVALALGAKDHSPLLGPAFISLGLTFVYGGSFFLLKPQQTANALRGSRLDGIPPRIRGAGLLIFGLWWTLVGVAGLFG
jgi:hypothetical protein